jgi:large subunit ribosomal protein L29
VLEKDDATLTAELVEKAKTLSTLRTQATIQKLENNSLIGKTRKDVARIKTALRQRQLTAKK